MRHRSPPHLHDAVMPRKREARVSPEELILIYNPQNGLHASKFHPELVQLCMCIIHPRMNSDTMQELDIGYAD